MGLLSACSAVPFLRNDPGAPRDRASRFDRFVGELDLALTDTAPLLERVRRSTRAEDLTSIAWDDERRHAVRRAVIESALRRLEREFSPNRLDDERGVLSRMLRTDLARLSLVERRTADGNAPTTLADLAGTPWKGLLVEAPSVLAREHPRTSAEDLDAWVATIETIVAASDLVIAPRGGVLPTQAYGAAFWASYRVPRVVVDQTLDDVVLIQASAGSGGSLDPLIGPLDQAAGVVRGRAARRFEDASRRPLERELAQTYEDLASRLEESLAAAADGEPRDADSLTDGEREAWLTLLGDAAGPDATPERLQALARIEVSRLTSEIAAVLGVETTDTADDAGKIALRAVRAGEIDVPGGERPRRPPELLWADARRTLGDLVAAAPVVSLRAEPALSFERPHGRWSPFVRGDLLPADDPRARASLYLVAPPDDASMPDWLREAETWRYGVPGRAVLDAFRRAGKDVPTTLRWTPREAFEEGWGLYAVQVAAEEGAIVEIDGGFGRLTQELIACTTLLVDLGIHGDGWSRRQAVAYLMDVTPLPEGAAAEIVLRCLAHPGRAAMPAIGMLRLRALRRRVESALEDRFDLAEFHRALLTGGPIPMTEMDPRLQRWAAAGAGSDG